MSPSCLKNRIPHFPAYWRSTVMVGSLPPVLLRILVVQRA
jgi:hypothetical protein